MHFITQFTRCIANVRAFSHAVSDVLCAPAQVLHTFSGCTFFTHVGVRNTRRGVFRRMPAAVRNTRRRATRLLRVHVSNALSLSLSLCQPFSGAYRYRLIRYSSGVAPSPWPSPTCSVPNGTLPCYCRPEAHRIQSALLLLE